MSANSPSRGRETLAERIWRSIFPGRFRPDTDQDRSRIVLGNLVLHNRPVRVPLKTIRYTHTFGLGGMSATLFILLIITGVPMMFVYEPSPGYAYESVRAIREHVLFGNLVRGIHYWSANLLVAMLFLHLARVYLTGGYHGPRRFNWVIGLGLFVLVLVSNFTGYLLPWDQLSYWAVTIVTGMLGYIPLAGGWLQSAVRGGSEIGSNTLVSFYAAHTTVVPVLILVVMSLHFWRVRKARGVVVPRGVDEPVEEQPEMVHAMPHLLLREFAAALVLVAFVMVLAVFQVAPHGDAANPGMSPDPAKAPWYFLGFQELLIHFDPMFAALIAPLLLAAALAAIPYFRYDADTSGIFLMSREGRAAGLMAAVLALVLTPVLVVADEMLGIRSVPMPGFLEGTGRGLLAALVVIAGVGGLYLFLRRRFPRHNNEAIQGTVIFLVVSFLVLTAVGIWFRGSGMALVWPWER